MLIVSILDFSAFEKHSAGSRPFGSSSTSSSHNHVSNSTGRPHEERHSYLAKLTPRPSGTSSSYVAAYQSALSRNCWNNDSSNSVTSLNNVRLSDGFGSRHAANAETTQDMDISPTSVSTAYLLHVAFWGDFLCANAKSFRRLMQI